MTQRTWILTSAECREYWRTHRHSSGGWNLGTVS